MSGPFAAVDNATAAFDYATEQQNQLRRIERMWSPTESKPLLQDTEFRNRLIEIFELRIGDDWHR